MAKITKRSNRYPIPLTAEEEHTCILCLSTKYEKEARKALILHNLRLSVFLADCMYQKISPQVNLTLDELISDSQYALVKAGNTFSTKRGARFTTYAVKCIRNMMLTDIRKVKKRSQPIPYADKRMERINKSPYGLDPSEDPVFDYVYLKIKKEEICIAISRLSDEEQRILAFRYFILGDVGNRNRGYSQKITAEFLGVSQSYVARLEKNVLEKIKKQAKCGTIEIQNNRAKE